MHKFIIQLDTNGLHAYFAGESVARIDWVFDPHEAIMFDLKTAEDIVSVLSQLDGYLTSTFQILTHPDKEYFYEVMVNGVGVWLTKSKSKAYQFGQDNTDKGTVVIRRRQLDLQEEGKVVYVFE